MKASMQKAIAGLLLGTQLLSGAAPVALAAETAETYRVSLFVEGIATSCQDANGVDIPILTYQGSTYVPLRSVGQWMGKEVNWDAATRTITLQGHITPVISKTPTFYEEAVKEVVLGTDIRVIIDGVTRNFTGADGKPVYPILINGASYLPLRAVSELLGMEVFWIKPDANNNAIFLRTSLTDAQKQEMQTYLDTADGIGVQIKELSHKLTTLRGEPTVTAESGLQTANQIYELLDKLESMKIPDAKIWEPYIPDLKEGIRAERAMLDKYTAGIKNGKTPDSFSDIVGSVNESGFDELLYAIVWFNISLNQYTKEVKMQ